MDELGAGIDEDHICWAVLWVKLVSHASNVCHIKELCACLMLP